MPNIITSGKVKELIIKVMRKEMTFRVNQKLRRLGWKLR